MTIELSFTLSLCLGVFAFSTTKTHVSEATVARMTPMAAVHVGVIRAIRGFNTPLIQNSEIHRLRRTFNDESGFCQSLNLFNGYAGPEFLQYESSVRNID